MFSLIFVFLFETSIISFKKGFFANMPDFFLKLWNWDWILTIFFFKNENSCWIITHKAGETPKCTWLKNENFAWKLKFPRNFALGFFLWQIGHYSVWLYNFQFSHKIAEQWTQNHMVFFSNRYVQVKKF